MKNLHIVAFILLVVGGLNWLLEAFGAGLGGWGLPGGLVQTVYVLVGISALYELFTHKKGCMMCNKGMGGMMK